MEARATTSRLAWAAFALGASLLGGSFLFDFMTSPERSSDLSSIVILPFVVVGIVITSQQPRSTIGWLLLGIGLVWGVTNAATVYAAHAWFNERTLPGTGVAMAVSSSSWALGIGLIGTFLLLLFPDGRLPSRRWRPWAWFCGVALLLPTLVLTFSPGPLETAPFDDVPNPLGLETLRPLFDVLVASILLVPLALVGCAIALIQRFRRSRGVERLQMKWLATAAGLVAAVYLLAMLLSVNQPWATDETPFWISVIQNLAFFSFVFIPVAIGIAILRYRLYDIDLIINRTLVYGALTATLAGTYVVIVTVAGTIVGGSELVTAGATLSVAALFQPLRSRIQSFINRRFYRSRYDAAQTVANLSIRLRDEIDLEAMRVHLLSVVQETMQPRRVSVWLRR